MAKLKVNPSLTISWSNGRIVLDGLDSSPKTLNDGYGLLVLDEFARPRDTNEVIRDADDPEGTEDAIHKLLVHGALIFEDDIVPMPADLIREHGLFHEIHRRVSGLTMSTPALNYALHKATEYVSRAGIEGAIVEAGVWRGGSAMVCALTLVALGDTDRQMFLYDTFDGSWGRPGELDGTIYGRSPEDTMADYEESLRRTRDQAALEADGISLAAVRSSLLSTGYPEGKLAFVKGLVEETIPRTLPERIALLRLDTDFYGSTSHELVHLFPRLEPGGILLVDDYPTETGATMAVDRYFEETGHRIFLARIDVQGRIGVKQR
jgi:hypothetical protein